MARKTTKKPRGKRSFPLLWLILLVLLGVAFPPSLLLFFFGMIPTFAAFLIDRTRQKYTTYCVGAMNLAGVFPYLVILWKGANDTPYAIDLLVNPLYLAVMYGAAAFGWLLFLSVPPFIVSMLNFGRERRISRLRREQNELAEEWGDDVRGRIAPEPAAPTAEAPRPPEAWS